MKEKENTDRDIGVGKRVTPMGEEGGEDRVDGKHRGEEWGQQKDGERPGPCPSTPSSGPTTVEGVGQRGSRGAR